MIWALLLTLAASAQAATPIIGTGGTPCSDKAITWDGTQWVCSDTALGSVVAGGVDLSTVSRLNYSAGSSTQCLTVYLKNNSTATATLGEVAVASPTVGGFSLWNVAASTRAIGVVADASVVAGAWGNVCVLGVAKIKASNASVTAAQHIQTAATWGRALGTNTPAAGATLGFWLEACAAYGTCWGVLK